MSLKGLRNAFDFTFVDIMMNELIGEAALKNRNMIKNGLTAITNTMMHSKLRIQKKCAIRVGPYLLFT